MEHLPFFILLSLLAEILGTVGGFGSSLFFVPIASFFLDFHSVLGITALFHLSSNISKILLFNKSIDKRLILFTGLPAIVFVMLGAAISKFMDGVTLEMALAIFTIGISVYLLLKETVWQPTNTLAVTGGIVSGFLAGLIGTGGAVRGIVLSLFNLKTEIFITTSAIIDLGIDAGRSVVYFYNGYMHQHDLYLIPILFLVSILGTYIGKKILLHVSEHQFKKTVLLFIFITGLVSFTKTLFHF